MNPSYLSISWIPPTHKDFSLVYALKLWLFHMPIPTKLTNLTKGNLKYQSPLWGTFEISKLNFFSNLTD